MYYACRLMGAYRALPIKAPSKSAAALEYARKWHEEYIPDPGNNEEGDEFRFTLPPGHTSREGQRLRMEVWPLKGGEAHA